MARQRRKSDCFRFAAVCLGAGRNEGLRYAAVIAQRVTVEEPLPKGKGRIRIHFAMSSQERTGGPTEQRSEPGGVHGAAWRPSSPLRLSSRRAHEGGSWDLRLALADLLDALEGHPQRPMLDAEGRPLRDRAGEPLVGGVVWQSVWLRVHAEAEGRVSLSGDQLPVALDPELRRRLIGPSVLDEILGYVDDDGHDVLGLAELTPPERDAVEFWLSSPSDEELGARAQDSREPCRRSAREVRDLMDRRRRRRGLPLAIETVEGYLSRARGKLRELADRQP